MQQLEAVGGQLQLTARSAHPLRQGPQRVLRAGARRVPPLGRLRPGFGPRGSVTKTGAHQHGGYEEKRHQQPGQTHGSAHNTTATTAPPARGHHLERQLGPAYAITGPKEAGLASAPQAPACGRGCSRGGACCRSGVAPPEGSRRSGTSFGPRVKPPGGTARERRRARNSERFHFCMERPLYSYEGEINTSLVLMQFQSQEKSLFNRLQAVLKAIA